MNGRRAVRDKDNLAVEREVGDRVWGDESPPHVRKVVHAHLSRIRRELAEVSRTGPDTVPLHRRSGGDLIDTDPDQIDLHRMRRLVHTARAGDGGDERGADLLREALHLWRGEPLAGLTGEWPARAPVRRTARRGADAGAATPRPAGNSPNTSVPTRAPNYRVCTGASCVATGEA